MSTPGHDYISTACYHGACGDCRLTCKYCDRTCGHICHQMVLAAMVPSWVDQARELARALYAVTGTDASTTETWAALAHRIKHDPALFWMRGDPPPRRTDCTCGADARNRERKPGERNEIHANGCPQLAAEIDRARAQRWPPARE